MLNGEADAGSDGQSGNSGREQAESDAATVTDPDSERKLTAAAAAIYEDIRQRRPRFVAAFDSMTFAGAAIRLRVPSQALHDEIMRSKLELLTRIAELAGVNGALTLEIAVDEEIRASKPIKLEDRVKFITDKNPIVNELRKALDLEFE